MHLQYVQEVSDVWDNACNKGDFPLSQYENGVTELLELSSLAIKPYLKHKSLVF